MAKHFISFCILSFVFNIALRGQDFHTDPIPRGKIETFQFKDSKIFPGTERTVWVYIPEEIDPLKPACVYVQQDGFSTMQRINDVFDTLIARKEMPITVGVFINPGNLLLHKNTLGRPNRCFEYDGLGDKYVRFVLDEILPLVAKKYNLNLSTNGNDRCIGGASSGGIAAFNAAWERPDAFSRVFCVSGSFVSFRGGNEFPALIRKTEARPIRVFLTAGTEDMENCAGDWTLMNMEMARALKFSGYDYRFTLLKGEHTVGWRDPYIITNAMRYLWNGWPAPVEAGQSAPRVRDIILPNEPWRLVADGYQARGLACNSKGDVFFSDKNKIYRVGAGDSVRLFITSKESIDDLSFGKDDALYAISYESGKIFRYEPTGTETVYADHIHGSYIIARPEGGLYLTSDEIAGEPATLWLVVKGVMTLVGTGSSLTGLAMSPDRQLLAVADSASHWVYSYRIARDGSLQDKERFFWLYRQDWEDGSGALSVCYDKEGHLYAATRMGVQICTWDGPTQVILPSPDGRRITSICFGGPNLDDMFAVCGDKLYKRRLKTHGIGAFTPWTAMAPGKL